MKRLHYSDLVEKTIELLDNDDDLFVECVDQLNSWDGFAEDFRLWEMDELDDYCSGMSASELLMNVASDFNICDTYFYWQLDTLESTNDIVEHYRYHTSSGEVFANLEESYYHLDLPSKLQEIFEALECFDDEVVNIIDEESGHIYSDIEPACPDYIFDYYCDEESGNVITAMQLYCLYSSQRFDIGGYATFAEYLDMNELDNNAITLYGFDA